MSKKWKTSKFRLAYSSMILLLILVNLYLLSAVRVSRVVTSNQPFSFGTFPSPYPLPSKSPEPLPKEISVSSSGNYLYNDGIISFTFPRTWQMLDEKATYPHKSYRFYNDKYHFISNFYFKPTDPNDPNSYKLGKKSIYGPKNQTSVITKIGNLTVGINTQPMGPDAGDYEPSITVDFLSNSQERHYYFIALTGDRVSFEETYKQDILPIIKSVELLD